MNAPVPPRVLTLTCSTRGFAFVFFRQLSLPLDWGMKEIRRKEENGATLNAITILLERLLPDILVLEDTSNARRSAQWRTLDRMICRLAKRRSITVVRHTKEEIVQSFGRLHVRAKYDLVPDIAEHIPALALRMPPKRKAWMSASSRQQLFDAAALGIAYEFHRR